MLMLAVLTAQAAFADKGHRLYQTSEFYGDSVVDVSRSSLRLKSSRLGLTLQVSKPDFQLSAVNDKTKQFGAFTFDHWKGFVLNQNGKKNTNDFFKRGTSKIAGLNTDEYWVEVHSRASVENKDLKDLWVKGRSYNTHYFVTKEITVPEQSFKLFAMGLGMPLDLGMPVRMVQYTREGRPFVTFDTKKVEPCTFPEKLVFPKGYSRATDEMAMLMGSTSTKALEALLKEDDEDDAAVAEKKTKIAMKTRTRGWVPGMTYAHLSQGIVKPAKRARGSWVPGW